jgi:hypothetical protein
LLRCPVSLYTARLFAARNTSSARSFEWELIGDLERGTSKIATAHREQREALLTIFSGKAGNPWFEVLASVVSKVLDPKFVPIEFSFDLKSRKAKVKFGTEVETTSEPIKNLATGDEHHILVDIPKGMEYRRPEIATTGILKSSGPLKFDCPNAHSSLAVVEHTHQGLAA